MAPYSDLCLRVLVGEQLRTYSMLRIPSDGAARGQLVRTTLANPICKEFFQPPCILVKVNCIVGQAAQRSQIPNLAGGYVIPTLAPDR